MKVGLLGGTFDPIHFGHLHLAIALAEAHALERVLFCPAHTSPTKQEHPPVADASHRKEMVERAIHDVPGCALLDWELMGSSPSYTVDTVRRWKRTRGGELYLLLGEDLVTSLPQWKEIDTLLELAPPLVGSRPCTKISLPEDFAPESLERIHAGHTVIPIMDISSTVVRKRLSEERFCGHLLPAPVLDYIREHRLYLS